MYSIQAVTDKTPESLALLLNMFAKIFPEETRYTDHLRECARWARVGGRYRLWLFLEDGQPIGFRSFSYLEKFNFGLSAYVGFTKEARGHRHARHFQQMVLDELMRAAAPRRPIGLVGEMPRGTNEANRTRIAIFEHLGAIILPLDYIEPGGLRNMPGAIEDKPALLYLIPLIEYHADLLPVIVQGVYEEGYRLPPDHPYIQRLLVKSEG